MQDKANELQAQLPRRPAAHAAADGGARRAPWSSPRDEYLDSERLVDARGRSSCARGRAPDAAKLYGNCQEDIGYNVLAAIAGDHAVERKAAEMFHAARDFAKAAQISRTSRTTRSAGAMYERADDPYMAAEMYMRAGRHGPKAAEMFEKHGNYQQAAEFFLKVKNFDKAAAELREVGEQLRGRQAVLPHEQDEQVAAAPAEGAEDRSGSTSRRAG